MVKVTKSQWVVTLTDCLLRLSESEERLRVIAKNYTNNYKIYSDLYEVRELLNQVTNDVFRLLGFIIETQDVNTD